MKRKTLRIDPKQYYTLSQTVVFLKGAGITTKETVKKHCRKGKKLKGKKKGAKQVWHVLGSSIIKLRKDLNSDE